MPYLNYVCRTYKRSKLLVDDSKPTREPDVKVVDILRINMDLLCKVLGGWFWVRCWFSHALAYMQMQGTQVNLTVCPFTVRNNTVRWIFISYVA